MFIIISVVILLVYIYYKNSFNYWRKRNVATQPPSFPFGNVRKIIFRSESVNDKVCEIYEEMKTKGHKYAGLYFFSRKVFLPIDAYLIKCILSKDFKHFNDRGIYYDEINDPVSAHLFSLSGQKWKTLRAKLTPAFTSGKIKYMFDAMYSCGNEMTALLDRLIALDSNHVDIKDVLARFTTDVIGSCAFGIDCNSLKNPNAEFRLMGKRAFTQTPLDAFKMVIIRSLPKLAQILRLSVFAPSVSRFFQQVVEDTVTYREKYDFSRPDFLQILMQLRKDNENALTLNEIAAQAFIFFLAGFETTSTTISFALFEMAMNEGIQKKARNELNRILRKYDNKLSYDAVAELNYLETVVLESLRKYPPAPVFLRKCTEAYQVPDTDLIIEKGISTLIPAMALHRDPDYFPEPDLFNPDRFNDENKYMIKDNSFMAFGDGPRICIGMRFSMVQSKLALAQILQNFEFNLNDKTKLPLVMEKKGIVLTPIGGIWLNMTRIN